MSSLMESGLEDGEDPMVISNNYVSILCLVTSETSDMSFDTRKSVRARLDFGYFMRIRYSGRQVVRPASSAC